MEFGGIWQYFFYVQAENRSSKRRLDGSLAKSLRRNKVLKPIVPKLVYFIAILCVSVFSVFNVKSLQYLFETGLFEKKVQACENVYA